MEKLLRRGAVPREANTMSANSLLLWMSARTEGSWPQFTTAVEDLHLPGEGEERHADEAEELAEGGLSLQNKLRLNLQRLGHAEFWAGAKPREWRIAPPVLAVSDDGETAKGVLAGARSRRLVDRVATMSASPSVTTTTQDSGPDAIVLEGESKTIRQAASSLGITVQSNAAVQILMALPVIDDRRLWRQDEAPVGTDWRIDRFSATELRWKGSDRTDFDTCSFGLFRFRLAHRLHVLLRARGGVYAVPGQVGKYVVLRGHRRRSAIYDSGARVFSVPAICRPPILVERALISATGLLPRYESGGRGGGVLHYTGISQEVALLTSSVLKQVLR